MQCDAMHYRVLLRRGVPARSVLPAGTANVCYRRSMPSRTNGLALTGDGRCGTCECDVLQDASVMWLQFDARVLGVRSDRCAGDVAASRSTIVAGRTRIAPTGVYCSTWIQCPANLGPCEMVARVADVTAEHRATQAVRFQHLDECEVKRGVRNRHLGRIGRHGHPAFAFLPGARFESVCGPGRLTNNDPDIRREPIDCAGRLSLRCTGEAPTVQDVDGGRLLHPPKRLERQPRQP